MRDYIRREDALNASKLVYIECIETDDGGFLEAEADYIPVVLKKDIKELPAADVVEQKHGKWIRTIEELGESWMCSECLEEFIPADSMDEFINYVHFCPNCGAKMDGER